ncbi:MULTISPECIES: chemotaxis protein CheD [unclassified Paenibacillus]|uniref:chemotaxis protein CheD n=1 Tax=unclassified Paenibacillus TaxID=185978 RepID=UPI000BA57241|nr:chemotaxis protein CheD [Paenibacillus sp. 7541]PAK54640.1 chemotaxis protein CheD [Paenibacillus sp. 7541]
MSDQKTIVHVGMADLNVAGPDGVLRTMGLGSCVGLTLYDPVTKIGGLAHVMLPSSAIAKEGQLNLAKYADTALPILLNKMRELGASPQRMIAKMAGGAQMFAFAGAGDSMRIGPRNVESCREGLAMLGIPIVAEDTGGNYGRTVELDCTTGKFMIRSVQMGIKEL